MYLTKANPYIFEANSTKGRVASQLNAATDPTGLKEITYVAGFDAGWEIDLFGKNRRALEAAKYESDAAIETRRAVLVSVGNSVRSGVL